LGLKGVRAMLHGNQKMIRRYKIFTTSAGLLGAHSQIYFKTSTFAFT